MGRKLLALSFAAALAACASDPPEAPDVTDSLRQSLDQAGLTDVSIDQDRERGVVTLSGEVAVEADKARAETLAKAVAGTQVVANQVSVRPPGAESEARRAEEAIDDGIEEALDAALERRKLDNQISHSVTAGVVTLTGEVNAQALRGDLDKMTAAIPNVKQVVNEIQVTNQRATSTQ
jgi:hyperosmotically inducible protein